MGSDPGSRITGDGMRRYDPESLRIFGRRVFELCGSRVEEADIVASHLVDSDCAGHPSHGIGVIPMYVGHWQKGLLIANAPITIAQDAAAIVTFDAGGGYGRPAGDRLMASLIDRARQYGIAAGALRNGHHLGRIGAFGEIAAEQGLISLHFANVHAMRPLVAPFGGKDARLSTNPVCIAVPARDAPPLLLDFSTSAIANNKVRVALGSGTPVPPDTVIDSEGKATTDPAVMFTEPRGALLPLGGHKGYALAVMCEILAGALSGIETAAHWPVTGGLVNNMLSIVIDPDRFPGGGRLTENIEELAHYLAQSPQAVPDQPVIMPGRIESDARVRAAKDGVGLDEGTVNALRDTVLRIGMNESEMIDFLGERA